MSLLSDLFILLVFFVFAIAPSQIEALINEGHLIINLNIIFINFLLALLIFILGKSAKWIKDLGGFPSEPKKENPPKRTHDPTGSKTIIVLGVMFSLLLASPLLFPRPFYVEDTITVKGYQYRQNSRTANVIYYTKYGEGNSVLLFDRTPLPDIPLEVNKTYCIRHTNGNLGRWRVVWVKEVTNPRK
jgi:hypothetical protein